MLRLLVAISSLLLFGYAVNLTPAVQTPAAPAPTAAIPPEAAKMTNPIKPTAESQAKAKKFYGYDCAMCHGETGNGKGELAEDMKLKMRDFTDPEAMKSITDGEMFYIIQNGKDKMPSEGDRAKPEDIWNMVVYVRALAKK